MEKKWWLIFGLLFLIIAIIFVRSYVFTTNEEVFVEKCYEDSIDTYSLAIATLDESLCVKTNYEENCKDEIIIIKSKLDQNPTICDNLAKKELIPLCKISVKDNSAHVCNDISGDEQLFCLALFGKNVEVCDKLSNEDGSADDCKLLYFLSLAIVENSDDPCNDLPGEQNLVCHSIMNQGNAEFYKASLKDKYCKTEYKNQI